MVVNNILGERLNTTWYIFYILCLIFDNLID